MVEHGDNMSDDAMQEEDRRKCVECGALSPRTETSYTLISAEHGWRLTRRVEKGRRVMEWRCPACWEAHRKY